MNAEFDIISQNSPMGARRGVRIWLAMALTLLLACWQPAGVGGVPPDRP